jgi:hypothetical protein
LPSQARALHEQILGSEFVLIGGCGHFTPYQSPGEFVSISLGFLIKHGPGLDQPPSLCLPTGPDPHFSLWKQLNLRILGLHKKRLLRIAACAFFYDFGIAWRLECDTHARNAWDLGRRPLLCRSGVGRCLAGCSRACDHNAQRARALILGQNRDAVKGGDHRYRRAASGSL